MWETRVQHVKRPDINSKFYGTLLNVVFMRDILDAFLIRIQVGVLSPERWKTINTVHLSASIHHTKSVLLRTCI